MGGMEPSSFWDKFYSDEFSSIGGINEVLNERKLGNQTDWAAGVSFLDGGVSNDQFGWGRMGFASTGILSGLGRGIGFFQYLDNPLNFFTAFGAQTAGADVLPTEDSVITQWTMASTAAVNTLLTRSAQSFTGLISQVPYNGYNVIADGGVFKRLKGTSNFQANVIYQPSAPTLPSTSGTGLTGYYAWCITLVDANGNESQPSALVASGNLANVSQVVSVGDTTAYATAGFTTIRFYRTLTNSATVAAADNPTFYHLVGKDTTITSTTQTITDAVADSTLTSPNNYRLTNVAYADGELKALGTGFVPKFVSSFQGIPIGANWYDGSSTYYPRRIYFGFVSDNSGTSAGNLTTWNKDNYQDFDTSDGDIIGIFAGLAGSFFVFCQNSTWVVQPTGNDLLPFSFTRISNDRGFFHHTVGDAGSTLYGRCKDGIFKFNGASYTSISYPIQRTLGRCLYPDGDSGVFDATSNRYFIAMCDIFNVGTFSLSAIGTGSHTGNSVKNIVTSLRNSVMVFNVDEGSWERYYNTGIQFFSQFADSSGFTKILALGMTSDIFFLTKGAISGPSYSTICAGSTNNFTIGTHTGGTLFGRTLYVPYILDPSSANFYFENFQSEIFLDVAGTLTTIQVLVSMSSSTNCMVCVDNAGGTITTGGSSSFTDTGNAFNNNGLKYYSAWNYNGSSLIAASGGQYAQVGADAGKITISPDTVVFATDQKYAIQSFHTVAFFPNDYTYYEFVLPPSGLKQQHQNFRKQFMNVQLVIRGKGPVLVDSFVDGAWNPFIQNSVPTQSQVIDLGTTVSGPVNKLVEFNGSNRGFVFRVRFRMVKGLTQFRLLSAQVLYRLQESWSNG